MFGTMQRGVNAYAKVGLETSVVSASPHKLIVMLYDGAMVAVLSGLTFMKAGNIPEKGRAISKAIQIVDNGLRASLDRDAGGQIADGLDALYEYMGARLLTANLNNDPAILEEVHRLLAELRDAWNAIGATPEVMNPNANQQPAPVLASA